MKNISCMYKDTDGEEVLEVHYDFFIMRVHNGLNKFKKGKLIIVEYEDVAKFKYSSFLGQPGFSITLKDNKGKEELVSLNNYISL